MTYPGVYMREISSGVRPIQGAGTSTAAFLGEAARGPIGTPVRIRNFTEFRTTFGGFLEEKYLAHAVFQFFNNGGSTGYVVRVAHKPGTAAVSVMHGGTTAHESLRLSAATPGVWGNALEVDVATSSADAENLFDLVVFLTSSGRRDEVERWPNLSMDPTSPRFVETVLRTGSTYLRASVRADAVHSVAGLLDGSRLTTATAGTLLDATHRTFQISLNGDGFQTVDLADADVTSLEKIRAALQTVISTRTPLRQSGEDNPYSNATVTLQGTGDTQALRVTSGKAGPRSTVDVRPSDTTATDAARLLGLYPLARRVDGEAVLRPTDAGNPYLIGDSPAGTFVRDPVRGSDGDTLQPGDYRDALRALDTVNDVSLIAIPGVGTGEVVDAGLNYCGVLRPLQDCFFIADVPREDDTPDLVAQWRDDDLSVANSYGAVYYPWLKVSDPNGGPETITVPPSGFVAGILARTDAQRGVWKTPAGVQASVAGAVGLARELTDPEQGDLNTPAKSVCVIRRFPAGGTVVWGGRTLSTDPEWRYIAPRRMAIFLRKSIFDGIQWAVFEPNDEPLWSQLRLNLNAFMTTLFRRGAFQGSSPDEAFFVKVDSETTLQADIDLGIVNILVGFAPLKPAEFVVVQLSQKAGQVS